jgi:hypothetical protein
MHDSQTHPGTHPSGVSRITFMRYAQGQNIRKRNNVKYLRGRKLKGPKWNSQIRLRSPMPEG